jgi:CheY-like chemotaxis protein
LNGQRSVLIVDRSPETREVLQTVLERRGVRTLAAGRADMGMELAERHHPDLIVLDIETCDAGIPQALCDLGEISEPNDTAGQASSGTPAEQYEPSIIVLGSVRGQCERLPGGEFLSKPYHYGFLIRRIEELLGICDTHSGSQHRADAFCHSRRRSGQPLRVDRARHPAGSRSV